MGKIAATEVGWSVALVPDNVIQNLESQLLHSETDGVDDVIGSAHPNRAIFLQHPLAGRKPLAIELVHFTDARRFVPLTLIYRYHPARMACDAVVGKEIGRVGEYHVNGAFGDLGKDL